ncbi:MAG: APC family permease [Candidatus Omnitrophica bacterium]|nr:APC family permease [Candidatus Omnitrophota bacterium]
MKKEIGALTLTGLTVGPILGSGILILPPIVYGLIKEWSIIAWLAIIAIGALFALIFGFLSIQFPGDGGVTNAIENVFGKYIKQLASFYLVIGVMFGPVAVLMTAAQYVVKLGFATKPVIEYSLLAVCLFFLLKKLTFLGKLVSIMSLLSAAVLLLGGIVTLISGHRPFIIESKFEPYQFGYALLLLFWTLFGWEIIGNYSAEVREPRKTITRSIVLSTVIIVIIDLVIAAAIQWGGVGRVSHGDVTITTIIFPVFRGASHWVMAILTVLLCSSTYLFFVGGTTRMMAGLADEKVLPEFISRRSKQNAPVFAVLVIGLLHLIMLTFVNFGYFNIEKLIAFANGFFLVNVLIGVAAGIVMTKNCFVRIGGLLLGALFLGMLIYFTSRIALIVIGLMALYYGYKQLILNRFSTASLF